MAHPGSSINWGDCLRQEIYSLCLYFDSNNLLWVGGLGGYCTFDGLKWSLYNRTNTEIIQEDVEEINLDANGNMWFGTRNKGYQYSMVRTRESLYTRGKQGFWGGGHVPLGYDIVDKKLKVNEIEKKIVQKIFNYYLLNPSSREVSRQLNAEGEKTKIRKSRDGEKTGGEQFKKQSIIDILKNKVYIGLIKVNKEYFKGLHEPIVDGELFEKVQQRLEKSTRDTNATRKTASPLTLLGITKCGICGNSLTTSSTKGGRHYYYKCSKKSHATSDHCSAKDLPAVELEKCIQQLLNFLVADEIFFNAVYRQIKNNSSNKVQTVNDDLSALKTNYLRIVKKIDNLINRMSEDEDLTSADSFKKIWKSFEDEKRSIEEFNQTKRK